jgi:NAD(P)-dependent dehydrogenase (short-subunit alcohol dehydrogenase family)
MTMTRASTLRRSRAWSLERRTVLITGGAGGIGRATAHELYRRGANVVVTDLSQDALAGELGDRALALAADVTDRAALDRAVAAAVERFGGLDVVFANAGIAGDPPRTVACTPDDVFASVVGVDLHGVWHTVRAGLPQIIERRGYVLITASIYAFANGSVNAPYAMSKAAVEQLGRALRSELAYRGASAGVLYPGWTDTPIAKVALHDPGPIHELFETVFPGPLRRPISPERVARAAVDGIERRAARIIVPRRWAPLSLMRGVVNAATDAALPRDENVARLIREVDRTSG